MNENVKLGFILGRDTALSVAEIFAYFNRINVRSTSPTLHGDVMIMELGQIDAKKISINSLGGTIKIFRVLGTYKNTDEIVSTLLSSLDFTAEKRINFGVSGYNKVNKKLVLNVGYGIKSKLLDMGYNSRFVTGKNLDLSSVIVTENKLIERGFEAIIVKDGNDLLLGTTITVQDYKAYSKRDFGRPKRDDRNGMLPPKLAQIMINLAALPTENSSLYDPFCGSGTILQEAMFLGYRDIYGSDIEKRNIVDTKENLEWLYQRFGMPKVPDNHVFVSDVLSLENTDKYSAVVGEGFLGSPVRRDRERAISDATELTEFYLKALTNLRARLDGNGRLVIAIPFFIVGKEYFYLPLMEKLAELGLEQVETIPSVLGIKLFGRGNLTYSRADQFVGREILVLEKS